MLAIILGLPASSHGKPGNPNPLPPVPVDLEQRLALLGKYLDAIYAPCATRVLNVRGDRAQLERTPAARLGDVFAVYPTGTVVLGAGATDPLPEPIARVRVVDVQPDSLVAIFEGDPMPLPTFAPALRILRDRALVVVWEPSTAGLRGLVDAWELPAKVYDIVLAHAPISLTGVAPPDIPVEQVVPHPDLLLDLPSTEVLTISVDPSGLSAQWSSAYGGEVKPVTVALSFRSASFQPLFVTSTLQEFQGTTQSSMAVFSLPMPVCDCATSPLESGFPLPGLWCLTDTSLVRFGLDPPNLLAIDSYPIAFPQAPPYRRSGAGLIRWTSGSDGWTLRVHRGQGGMGLSWRISDGQLAAIGPIEGLPVANLPPSEDTIAPPDAKGVGRFLRSVDLPDVLPSPLIALASNDHSLASVDGAGHLQLILEDGTQITAPGSGYGGALVVTSKSVYVSQGSRIVRLMRDVEGRFTGTPTASPVLPGMPISIVNFGEEFPFDYEELWVVLESPQAAGMIVRLDTAGWKAADVTKSSRGWPVMGGDATLGLPVSKLGLTPEEVATPLERQLFSALYDTPLRLLPDGKTAPLAAQQISHNGTDDEWELQLQPGLMWPGGTPVTATEVKAGWEQTIRQHAFNAPAFELVEGYRAFNSGPATNLAGIEVVDARTLLIKLSEPEPKFDTYLADPTWAIVRGEERVLAGQHASLSFRQGTGPFQPLRITNDVIELGRNQWHIQGMPYLATWRWSLLGSGETVSRSALAGRLEFASLTTGEWPVLAGESRFAGSLLDQPSQATLGLLVNPASPLLATSSIARLALFASLDLNALRRITLGGLVDPAGSHFGDRLGLAPVRPTKTGRLDPGTLRIAVTEDDSDALAAAERIRTELEGSDPRWRIDIMLIAPSMLRRSRGDWDIALWTLAGSPQPVLTESREFRHQWKALAGAAGGGQMESEPPYAVEAFLIREGWWRVIGHPRQMWLRSPKLRSWIGQGRTSPAWADAWWDR